MHVSSSDMKSRGMGTPEDVIKGLEIYRVSEDELLRRLRARQVQKSDVLHVDPLQSLLNIRIKHVESKTPATRKEKQKIMIVAPSVTEFGIPRLAARGGRRSGIRLMTRVARVPVDDSGKDVPLMIAVFDESDGPPNPPSVMRIEALHPHSGEMVSLRIGPEAIASIGLLRGEPGIMQSGFRHAIADLLVSELILQELKGNATAANCDQTSPPMRELKLLFQSLPA